MKKYMVMGLLLSLSIPAFAIDWPNYRGVKYDGASPETDWQVWTESGPKVLWQSSIGTGFSSIVVANGAGFSMGNTGIQDVVWCFNVQTGQEIWRHLYDEPIEAKLYEGGPNATPTVVDNKVYTVSRTGKLFCLEAATGKVVWQRDLVKEHGIKLPDWGISSSPLVIDGVIYLNAGTLGMALKASDGSLVWLNGTDEAGYATVVPFKNNLIVLGAKHVAVVQASNGKVLDQAEWPTRYGINAADPIVVEDEIFVSSGYNYGCGLFRWTGRKMEEIYRNKNMMTQCYGAVFHQGFVYGFSGQVGGSGKLTCLELKTGEVKWAQEGLGTGTVLLAGDKLIALGEKGKLVMGTVSPQGYQELAAAQVLNDKCWTVPVLSEGLLLARDAQGTLVCLDLR